MSEYKKCPGMESGQHHYVQLTGMSENEPAIFCVNCGDGKKVTFTHVEGCEKQPA